MNENAVNHATSLQKVFHDLMGFFQAASVVLRDVETGKQYPAGLRHLSRATLERMDHLLPEVQYFYRMSTGEKETPS